MTTQLSVTLHGGLLFQLVINGKTYFWNQKTLNIEEQYIISCGQKFAILQVLRTYCNWKMRENQNQNTLFVFFSKKKSIILVTKSRISVAIGLSISPHSITTIQLSIIFTSTALSTCSVLKPCLQFEANKGWRLSV